MNRLTKIDVVWGSVVLSSISARHRVDLSGGQPCLQAVIGIGISVLPLATNAPATVIGHLQPRVAFTAVIQDMKRNVGLFSLAGLLDRCLN